MRYGILSDLHSNLAALEAALRELEKLKVDRLICLGDVVGYGPQPNECIDLVRAHVDLTLLGNHDAMALQSKPSETVNIYAQQAIEWTRSVLSEERREWLRGLPYYHTEGEAFFVHATPKSPADWGYVGRLDEAIEAFRFFSQRFCFLGHTHRPFLALQVKEGEVRILHDFDYSLESGERLLVNVGSVGQPRDLDPRGSMVIWEEEVVELIRFSYDYTITQKKMREVNLPSYLIRRLEEGS